jgi:hypothetical protein
MANPKRTKESYQTKSYKEKQSSIIDNKFGKIEKHILVCETCKEEFKWIGRKKTKEFEKKKFCSRSCANYRGSGIEWEEKMGKEITSYRTIAFSYYEEKCMICGFDKVVEVHHIDKNRENKNKENLAVLCPNHHTMIHMKKYKKEILNKLKEALNKLGVHVPLAGETSLQDDCGEFDSHHLHN